jgi:hypothetical protein
MACIVNEITYWASQVPIRKVEKIGGTIFTHIDNRRDDLYFSRMSQALFTVIGGTLVNLAKVNFIENSSVVGHDGAATGRVRVHFENKEQTTLDGSVETVLLKIGGSRDDMNRKPRS